MKTKIIISLSIIITTAFMMSCTEQPYFDIPYDENGNVLITEISEVTSDGVTTADDNFTINGYFPNAQSGDTMTSTVLKRQVPSWDPGGAEQLLPVEGTEKSITVADDHTASVTYSRSEAQLMEAGDAVTIVFSGETDSGIIEIVLREAS